MPTLADIAALLSVPLDGDGSRAVTGLANLDEAGPGDLSFLGSEKYLDAFTKTKAAGVIVHRKVKFKSPPQVPTLIVDDADLAVAKALEFFAPPIPRPATGVHPAAVVSSSAILGKAVRIGANVFVGDNVRLGDNVILHPGVHVGADTIIGDDCELFPNVVIRERITLGRRVIVNANSAIGTDGFGYRWDGQKHAKIPQIGTVIIEDDVEIGSCVCIDRAKFSTTRVGRGTKIDNLVQIAHNVTLGPHCIIVGQAGVAGSCKLGAGVVLGGQCAVRDHVNMGDGSMSAACAGVAEDVDPKTIVSGIPALPHRQFLREQAALRRLPELMTQLRKMQEQLDALTKR